MKRYNHGFTLIELIVVIVILGILAVTAAPKFMNLQSDARIAALEGLRGNMLSAAKMVYGKAIIAGKEKAESAYICPGVSASATCTESSDGAIEIRYGHPHAKATGILRAMDIDAADVSLNPSNADGHDWAYKSYVWGDGSRNTQILIGFPQSTDKIPEKYQGEIDQSTYSDKCFLFYDTPTVTSSELINFDGLRVVLFTGGC